MVIIWITDSKFQYWPVLLGLNANIAEHWRKRKKPGASIERLRALVKIFRRRPTLPHSYPCSTIGAEELNFRVRDGNGCRLFAIATEKLRCKFAKKNLNVDAMYLENLCQLFCGQAARPISTSKLNTLLCVHTWPINLVVYKGSLVPQVALRKGYLILGLASRLDAFSGYPCRT